MKSILYVNLSDFEADIYLDVKIITLSSLEEADRLILDESNDYYFYLFTQEDKMYIKTDTLNVYQIKSKQELNKYLNAYINTDNMHLLIEDMLELD